MTEQAQPRKSNELDIVDVKRYAYLINNLSWQIDTALDFITEDDMKKVANNTKVAQLLEIIVHVYPAYSELIRLLKNKINDLPDFIIVDDDKGTTNEL